MGGAVLSKCMLVSKLMTYRCSYIILYFASSLSEEVPSSMRSFCRVFVSFCFLHSIGAGKCKEGEVENGGQKQKRDSFEPDLNQRPMDARKATVRR